MNARLTREEMIQELYFYFLSKNYSDDYLDKLSDEEIEREFRRYRIENTSD